MKNINNKKHYIINNINKLDKNSKIIITKILWKDPIIKSKISEKGVGLSINMKYIKDDYIEQIYKYILSKLIT
tara:strand:- start:14080 stop:14298 length:219 start_codon:yes stop_codon:yes gene_type:complete